LEISTNLAKNAKGGIVKHPLSANVGIGGCESPQPVNKPLKTHRFKGVLLLPI
jgi:hypothetical protein